MKYLIIACAFCVLNLTGTLKILAQVQKQPVASQNQARRKTKVDVRYDKKKDMSTLRLEDIVLWKNPTFFEEVAMVVRFDYPKRTIVTPKSVLLIFYAATKDRMPFPNEDFAVAVDGVRLNLGTLERRGNKDLTPRTGFFMEGLRISVPYQDFIRLTLAKKLRLEVAGSTYDLTDAQIQMLADFLLLMKQEGQEFK